MRAQEIVTTSSAIEFLDAAWEFLRQRPVENSVLLSVATVWANAEDSGASENLWLWVNGIDGIAAAAQHTPPYGAYLSPAPAEAVRLIAHTLHKLRPALPGVVGFLPVPEQFATEWQRLGGIVAGSGMREGVYVADSVRIPSGVRGGLRRATKREAALLRAWAAAFAEETGVARETRDYISPRIEAGWLYVWETDDGVVSMAATTPALAGVSRVHLVYTPPRHRRQGFASACVAALTEHVLATPGNRCMLFTDLANPTSNDIYQKIGYCRVADAAEIRFAAGP